MSKFFKALEQAERERALRDQGRRQEAGLTEVVAPRAPASPREDPPPAVTAVAAGLPSAPPRRAPQAEGWTPRPVPEPTQQPAGAPLDRADRPEAEWARPAVERYEDLKANILSRYPAGSIKTILFTGTAQGDGASTTAVNFASTLAMDRGLEVLLIDANLRTPSLHGMFKIDHAYGLMDIITQNGCEAPPIRVGPENLHVIPCGGNHSEPVTLFQSHRFNQFLKKMRDRYDYVILDAPPVQHFPECRVLCLKVDGVILVIESGKTRRHVALSAKKHLEKAGAKILGVVMNRRRYHIPEFIYRWL